jgi:hypothetical protein
VRKCHRILEIVASSFDRARAQSTALHLSIAPRETEEGLIMAGPSNVLTRMLPRPVCSSQLLLVLSPACFLTNAHGSTAHKQLPRKHLTLLVQHTSCLRGGTWSLTIDPDSGLHVLLFSFNACKTAFKAVRTSLGSLSFPFKAMSGTERC